MSAGPTREPLLTAAFATSLPELGIAWQAEVVSEPELLVVNDALAAELEVDPAWLRGREGLDLLTGTRVTDGGTPVAQAYAGHQFGGWSPRLGDGRALLLGELSTADGSLRDLHLKGSGRTPFSRGGDGFATVGPMLREYVVGEAMHALGVPTTRALAVVGTGRGVRRETVLTGAVLARVASSHLRVGTFQYARSLDDVTLLRRLADHAIARHHPACASAEEPYVALFEAVVGAQAALVARWMSVGFVHGVMNTDNMTISGETIDYGPCAFLDAHDRATVYSSIDSDGRYAYGNQPAVAEWNLARLAEALLPLLGDDQDVAVDVAVESLKTFRSRYSAAWHAGMRAKLGLGDTRRGGLADELADELAALMQANAVDHTSFLRRLSAAARGDTARARDLVLDVAGFDAWVARWLPLSPDPEAMDRANPVYIPRNHLVEEALAAATADDLLPLRRLVEAVSAPYAERPGLERYAEPAPDSFGHYRTFCGT